MAAAEARAVWQRTANRYFVQEDAKRAPKIACSSSSSSSKPQVDMGQGETTNGPDHAPAGFVPLNWNTSNSNLPPDTKWWLQLQPNFGHPKDFTSDQLNSLEVEVEVETFRNEEIKKMSNLRDDLLASEEDISRMPTERKMGSSLDLHQRVSASCRKNDSETMVGELTAAKCDVTKKTYSHKNMGEYWYKNQETRDTNTVNHFSSKQPEKLFDLESPWIEKTEPWWRTADRDELASLVVQKSLEHVENCDLPPPQATHVRKGPFACVESFNQNEISFDSVDHPWDCLTSGNDNGKHQGSGEKGLAYGLDILLSSTNNRSTYPKDTTDTRNTSPSETTKAQLMEALRHSQTRAREAENAAQKAYDEKEHIIKLFFRQASHLFAYKQWLQVLQLETICLQLKNKEPSISTLFPVFLPWAPYKSRQGKKYKHKTKKTKHSHPRYGISRYAFAFALGLGLAGAGFLLGWTMGWLFPMF